MTPEEFFGPYPGAALLYQAVSRALHRMGEVEIAATKSQVTFRRRGGAGFAWLWIPQMALKRGAPDLYLAFGLPHEVSSPRIKEAYMVKPGWYTHHVRIGTKTDIDSAVLRWLQASYDAAG